MTVFKGYLIIIKRNLRVMFLYLAIFIGLTFMLKVMIDGTMGDMDTSSIKLKVAVIDRDHGELAKGVIKYIKEKQNLVKLPDVKKRLQEEMFYGGVDYIVIIPKDFEQVSLDESKALEVTKKPGDYSGVYVDQQITQFLNAVKTYSDSGCTVKESVENVLKQTKNKPDIVFQSVGNEGRKVDHMLLFQLLPYLYISVISYCLGILILIFKDKDIKRRLKCSSVSDKRQNGEAILAYILITAVFWCISMIIPILMYGKGFLNDPNISYIILNSICMLIVAFSLAIFVSAVTKSLDSVNGVVTVISLAMCFICGVFVSTSMLGEGIRKFSAYLPVYWYINNNNIFGEHAVLTETLRNEIWKGFGIQIIFAAACIFVALAVNKSKEQEKD